MAYGNYTILFRRAHTAHKLCRIWFGADGSYYVTSPYHPEGHALLMKIRVNYALQEMIVALEEALDTAALDDDQARLKLAHHPDGFVQFSGHGILSGRDADGNARGMGTMSWPLDRPVRGPAFGLVIRGVDRFEESAAASDSAVEFVESDLVVMPGWDTLCLEGHYLPGLWRRFVHTESDGTRSISVFHPCKAVVKLRVLEASQACARDGFIGLELYTLRPTPDTPSSPFFSLTGPTGNIRRNLEGQVTADSIQCVYPRQTLRFHRRLEYGLPEIESPT